MMKLHEVKLPSIAHYSLRYVFPAAACVLVLAGVSLPGRVSLPLFLQSPAPEETNTTDGRRHDCDIFKGEWVPDTAAGEPPPYTTESCPVIHGHYDCARYGRPDIGYVRWRWWPDGDCELRRLDAARFLAAMRGKSVAFVGDSLARNQMHSLVCLLSRAESPSPSPPPAATATNASHVYRYEQHGVTVAAFWSPFLVRAAVEADDDTWRLHLDEPDARWAARVAAFDVVVISAGSWFYRPSVFYDGAGRLVGCNACLSPNITDLTLRYPLRMAFRTALRAAAAANARGTGSAARRTVVVRTISPSHYENGTWDGDGDCVRTRPVRRRGEWEMNPTEKEMHRIQVEEFAAAAEKAAAKRGKSAAAARLMLMDATEAMAQRPDAHPSKYRLWQPDKFNVSRDCVHWCLPGAMDACNDMLFHMLVE